MISFVVTDSSGLIIRSGAAQSADSITLAPGEVIHLGLSGIPRRERVVAGQVVAVEESLVARRAELLASLAERRWQAEIGGIALPDGTRLDTDDRAKLLITGARAAALADPGFATRWKCAGGQWLELDSAQVLAAYAAIFGHVSACFAREAEIAEMVAEAESIAEAESVAALIAPFWADA